MNSKLFNLSLILDTFAESKSIFSYKHYKKLTMKMDFLFILQIQQYRIRK